MTVRRIKDAAETAVPARFQVMEEPKIVPTKSIITHKGSILLLQQEPVTPQLPPHSPPPPHQQQPQQQWKEPKGDEEDGDHHHEDARNEGWKDAGSSSSSSSSLKGPSGLISQSKTNDYNNSNNNNSNSSSSPRLIQAPSFDTQGNRHYNNGNVNNNNYNDRSSKRSWRQRRSRVNVNFSKLTAPLAPLKIDINDRLEVQSSRRGGKSVKSFNIYVDSDEYSDMDSVGDYHVNWYVGFILIIYTFAVLAFLKLKQRYCSTRRSKSKALKKAHASHIL